MTQFRGSLRQCILRCADIYHRTACTYLSIICVPRGKYYYILADNELEQLDVNSSDGEQRLVFRGTFKELSEFFNSDQCNLFKGIDNASNSKSI